MGLRVHIRVRHQHLSIRSDEVRDAFGEWDQSPPGADRFRQLVVAVAEQAERQRVLFGELPVLFRGVVGNAENLDPEFLELVPAVPQPVGFERSTGGTGLRVKEEEERAALEIGTRHRGAIMGLEFEIDKRLADGNHLSGSFGVADRGAHRQQ